MASKFETNAVQIDFGNGFEDFIKPTAAAPSAAPQLANTIEAAIDPLGLSAPAKPQTFKM